jgi:peptidoglycan/xylan/chitin deacetylase (PgdA/CDA1 family)
MRGLTSALRSGFRLVEHASVALLPFCRLAERFRPYRIPVLTYHRIVATRQLTAALTCSVCIDNFARQMTWLREQHYEPVSLDAYVEHLTTGRPFPPRSVLITFDDGYQSLYTRAFPILKRYDFPATVFLITDHIGKPGLFPADEKYAHEPDEVRAELAPLTWQEVDAMAPLVTAASHTASHPRMARLDRAAMLHEAAASREVIARCAAGNVDAFASPHGIRHHGDYSDATRAALIEAGYRVAFNAETGRNGASTDPYCQYRTDVRDSDTRLVFLCKLTGAFDWVGVAQSAFHRAVRPDSAP